jgi:hypothetical protein
MALEFLTKLFGGNPVKEIGEIADKFITTKQEKKEFELEVEKFLQSKEDTAQDTISARHANDMKSDSWLSKNIRPLIFIFSFAMVTLFAFTDGNIGEFSINQEYIEIYKLVLGAAITFYFVGRSWEKVQKIKKG